MRRPNHASRFEGIVGQSLLVRDAIRTASVGKTSRSTRSEMCTPARHSNRLSQNACSLVASIQLTPLFTISLYEIASCITRLLSIVAAYSAPPHVGVDAQHRSGAAATPDHRI